MSKFFVVRVQTNSDYNHIRMDKWNTPVRTNIFSECTNFESKESALEMIEKFMLVSTFYPHEVLCCDLENNPPVSVVATCTFVKKKNGKFGLHVQDLTVGASHRSS
ncbi:hypothetical protein FDH34_gp417 [Serratia phage BF]|uniref:Uncharacterized protein n=1 Tax=Serratia phage BF TaxID=1962671 RepID=A0A1S6UBB5_9CAUD|nr:hypothetical protein FDH34_gp417 [Serratia phage BF]AQW89028.1 hypothetical protein BF_0503 [Serratia phage BF]